MKMFFFLVRGSGCLCVRSPFKPLLLIRNQAPRTKNQEPARQSSRGGHGQVLSKRPAPLRHAPVWHRPLSWLIGGPAGHPARHRDANHNRGAGIFPAQNHVLLLEDEPSHCQRGVLTWKLKEVEIKNAASMIIATREPKNGGNSKATEEKMTFDAATRVWRGRECLVIEDLITEGAWPAEGKKALNGQSVLLGITWKPTPDGIFTRFHISDIWLDDAAMQRAAHHQTALHKAFIRSHWMPAWIDHVEYGKFGRRRLPLDDLHPSRVFRSWRGGNSERLA